eukprot:3758254-Rhodomonas_salina.3
MPVLSSRMVSWTPHPHRSVRVSTVTSCRKVCYHLVADESAGVKEQRMLGLVVAGVEPQVHAPGTEAQGLAEKAGPVLCFFRVVLEPKQAAEVNDVHGLPVEREDELDLVFDRQVFFVDDDFLQAVQRVGKDITQLPHAFAPDLVVAEFKMHQRAVHSQGLGQCLHPLGAQYVVRHNEGFEALIQLQGQGHVLDAMSQGVVREIERSQVLIRQQHSREVGSY